MPSTFDKELALEILTQINGAVEKILRRFAPIQSVDDFTNSESGMEKLDSICMQLIAIGEALKNLDRITKNELLPRYPEIEWDKIKGMRDIISHHYFDVDAEIIFEVCENRLKTLSDIVSGMIRDLRER
jgi:uncharacterized protein with HEPN domain